MKSDAAAYQGPAARPGLAAVMLLVASSFAVGAVLQAGITITVGGLSLPEPVIGGAAIVEGMCGAVFVGGAAAGQPWSATAATPSPSSGSSTATPPTPTCTSPSPSTPGDVDAFYMAVLAAGATSRNEPAFHPEYHPDYYGAFVNDPDGTNLEAVCHHRR